MNYTNNFGLSYSFRLLICLFWAVLLIHCWDKLQYQFDALVFLTTIIVYQAITLLPIVLYRYSSWQNIFSYMVSFIDTVLACLLIVFVDNNYIISLALLIGILVVYISSMNAHCLSAIIGILIIMLTNNFYTYPTIQITPIVESIILTLLLGSYMLYVLIKQKHNQIISDQLDYQKTVNRELTLWNFKLSKYLSPVLSKSIKTGTQVHVQAKEKSLTIFFSDMQGFSELSEELTPEKLTWLINSYLAEMSEIIFRFGGTLDKVIGDSLMVFFGDPNSRGEKNDAVACVCMALSMNAAMQDLKKRWIANGISNPPSLRIGINSGICKVGNFGTENRLEYTVLGSAVNLASRLESIAGLDEILLSESTYMLVKDRVQCDMKNTAMIKGHSNKVTLYKATNIYKNIQLDQSV